MQRDKAKPRLYITAPRNYLLKQTIKSNKDEEDLQDNYGVFNSTNNLDMIKKH